MYYNKQYVATDEEGVSLDGVTGRLSEAEAGQITGSIPSTQEEEGGHNNAVE